MESWAPIAALGVALAVALVWAWGTRPPSREASDDGERSAVDFVHEILALLRERGVEASVVGGSFDVQIEGGRRLPLTEGFQRHARDRVDDAAHELVDGWARAGLLEGAQAFADRVADRLRAEGHPAEVDDRPLRVRVGDALLVLDAAWARLGPVDDTVGEIVDEVSWWRAPLPPLDEIEDALEVQLLPAARVAREDLAARLRDEAIAAQPVAHLGAGWVARVVWKHGAMIRPVGREAHRWDLTPEALLQRVATRAPAGGHPLRRWQPGVLQGAHGDARDLRLLLLDDDVLAEVGVAPPVAVWPLQADRVVVASTAEPGALARLLERAFDGDPVREPLSWVPLVRSEDGRWQWLEVSDDHELFEAVQRLVGEQVRLEYGWVFPAVRALARAGLEPPPVPVDLDDDGQPVARWTGGPALVPAEVRTVEHAGRVRTIDAWVQEVGAVARTDLGPPWWQIS